MEYLTKLGKICTECVKRFNKINKSTSAVMKHLLWKNIKRKVEIQLIIYNIIHSSDFLRYFRRVDNGEMSGISNIQT